MEKSFSKKRSIGELIRKPLTKAPRVKALLGVDLEVRKGEIFGLLGPNGAGKTTLLKILSCLILPDKGQARIQGIDIQDENRVKPLIGLIQADERSFYWRISARENLRFFARLYNVPGPEIDDRVTELLGKVNMLDAADRAFSGYSSGMKQRIAIARALLHDPPIIYMDEPTRSLDPAAALSLRDFVLNELRVDKTIILTTHNLHEAEAMADRVAVLIGGKVREVGTVDAIRRWGLEGDRYTLELDAGTGPLDGPFELLADDDGAGMRRISVRPNEGVGFEQLLRYFLDRDLSVHSCDREEPDLEGAFERILAAEKAAC